MYKINLNESNRIVMLCLLHNSIDKRPIDFVNNKYSISTMSHLCLQSSNWWNWLFSGLNWFLAKNEKKNIYWIYGQTSILNLCGCQVFSLFMWEKFYEFMVYAVKDGIFNWLAWVNWFSNLIILNNLDNWIFNK